MITIEKNLYALHTRHTSYVFCVMESGHPEHLYYGRRIHAQQTVMMEKRAFLPGNTIAYDSSFENLSLEDCCLEMSSYGKGDIREPFIETEYADGSTTADFLFESAQISENAACRHFRVHMMKTANPNSSRSFWQTKKEKQSWNCIMTYTKTAM